MGVEYRHDTVANQSVDYTGEKWSERYNVSKTYQSDRANATVTIPFEGTVVDVRDFEYRINDSSWSDVPKWSMTGTTLEAEIGDVEAGATLDVRANGSKVVVHNGAIEVTEPTVMGSKLSSGIEITSHSSDFHIEVSDSTGADRINYLANESWSSSDYAHVTNGGDDQSIYAPNAGAGSTATARVAPIDVEPQTDAKVSIIDADRPEFKIEPGSTTGDSMKIRYYDTTSGSTYALKSKTRDGYKVDSDTAESPAIFDLGDDDSEVFYIELVEQTTGSSGGGGGGGGVPVPTKSGAPLSNPLLLIPIAGVVVFGGAVGASKTGVGRWAVVAIAVVAALLSVVALVPNAISRSTLFISRQLGSGLGQVSPVLWLAGGGIGLYAIYRFVKAVTTRDSVVIEAVRRGR
ncbi:hypothetical protein DV707_07605 [Halobellus limi]|uniref:Uncharacterized protein n=1 Tax=Halobellus limi TaxID=699433 RepID=A0A4D6H321_9EURY|nr:hypothetical protein DV707_07605 [Halobellus limi]